MKFSSLGERLRRPSAGKVDVATAVIQQDVANLELRVFVPGGYRDQIVPRADLLLGVRDSLQVIADTFPNADEPAERPLRMAGLVDSLGTGFPEEDLDLLGGDAGG